MIFIFNFNAITLLLTLVLEFLYRHFINSHDPNYAILHTSLFL
jgi:hypothetical protein